LHPKLHKIPMEEFLDNLRQGEKIRNQRWMDRERSKLWCDHYGECIYNPIIVRPDRRGEFKYNIGDGCHRTQVLFNAGASHIWAYVIGLGEKYPRYMMDEDNCMVPKSAKGKVPCRKCGKYQRKRWSEEENDIYYYCEECDVKEYSYEYNRRLSSEEL
ncbi:MAG: hypothetical protein ACTSPB_24275, partial [Candidatus Thorarchaeota archaeon]